MEKLELLRTVIENYIDEENKKLGQHQSGDSRLDLVMKSKTTGKIEGFTSCLLVIEHLITSSEVKE